MKAGKMRHIGELQRDEPVRDGAGQPVAHWITFDEVYMRIVGLSGREYISRAGEAADATHRIEMRAYEGLNNTHRIKCEGRIFNILYVSDIDLLGKEMHLIAKEQL